MRRTILILWLLAIAPFAYTQNFASAFEINQRLGRGINMGNAFEAPLESAWGNPWKEDYFKRMAELGFTHVRIPIRWETTARSMATEPYTIYASFMQRIQQVVDAALKYKLHPIINMHHHEAFLNSPVDNKARFLAMWTQIGNQFKNYPDSLLFELFNEPHGNITPSMWNGIIVEALNVIRPTNPERTILIGTAPWGGLEGLANLVLPDDAHLILTVHYYNPFQFTHQGADWVGGNADSWLGTEWFDTQAERDAVIADFTFAKAFAQEKNIPLHVGEFGAYGKADIASRARWTTFLSRWFDQQGFSWAYWEFSAGFGIFNPSTSQYNMALVNALLHNTMPEPMGFNVTPLFNQSTWTNTAGWSLNFGGGASGSLSVSSGKLNANINSAGTQTWHVQLVKPSIALENGSMYRIIVVASAAEPRTGAVYIGKSSDPWTAYSGYVGLSLGKDETEYSTVFKMTHPTDNNARFVVDLGTSAPNVVFSRIAVEKVTLATHIPVETTSLGVKVFPNPASRQMVLENVGHFTHAALFDLSGRLIKSVQVDAPSMLLSVNHLDRGVYIIRLTGNCKSETLKFIKN